MVISRRLPPRAFSPIAGLLLLLACGESTVGNGQGSNGVPGGAVGNGSGSTSVADVESSSSTADATNGDVSPAVSATAGAMGSDSSATASGGAPATSDPVAGDATPTDPLSMGGSGVPGQVAVTGGTGGSSGSDANADDTGGAEAATGGASTTSDASGGAAAADVATTDPVDAPPAAACATPLAERVTITAVPVSAEIETRGSGINSVSLPVILSTSPNGRAKVAWSDGDNAYVTPLDEAGGRAADDIAIQGSEVRGFVAHDDGSAIIVVRGDAMVFERLDEAGSVQGSLEIVGNQTHTVDGARWIDDWPHQGRLAWSGAEYAAYFGQTGNHGAAGDHQGDHLAFINPAGERQSGGWDWGCSHSLDSRIVHNGVDFAPICISDSYPGSGIFYRNRVEVSHEPSVTNVGGVAKLGGLVPAPDGFWMTFTSPEDRASPDVVFIHIDNEGAASGRAYLTDTGDVEERFAHLALYGEDQLLAGWDSGGNVSIAVLDQAGAVVEGPVETAARIGGQDDFATFAGGDAGWAAAWENLDQLRVVRVARCE